MISSHISLPVVLFRRDRLDMALRRRRRWWVTSTMPIPAMMIVSSSFAVIMVFQFFWFVWTRAQLRPIIWGTRTRRGRRRTRRGRRGWARIVSRSSQSINSLERCTQIALWGYLSWGLCFSRSTRVFTLFCRFFIVSSSIIPRIRPSLLRFLFFKRGLSLILIFEIF